MLIVQKFGGTSVAGIERIKASCEIVKKNVLSGKTVVVVVSAMAGETDRLIRLFKEISSDKEDAILLAEMDSIIATGEQVCAGLFASYLNTIGIKARSFTGFQAGILTDAKYTKAQIEAISLLEVQDSIKKGFTPIITGFQGFSSESGRQTTFGRGGSDTSAIAISAAISADKCEIYKDVDGVFTGDPTIIENPTKKDFLDYETMLEISSSGTKVLELRSVNFASKYNVKTEVLSSFFARNGTSISNLRVNEKAKIENISYSEKEFIAILPCINISETLASLNEKNISFQVISLYENFLTLFVKNEDASKLSSGKIEKDIAKISIIGVFLKSDKILEKAFEILSTMQIAVIISIVSETKITLVIASKFAKKAYQKLYDNLTF